MSRTASPKRTSAPRRSDKRAGLVLGAGGVLGAAWMAGALAAVQAQLSYPVEEIDVIVGASAGSNRPPWRSWCPGSPRLILKALRAPGSVHPWVKAAACLPRGRAGHDELRRVVNSLLAYRHRAGPAASARGQTWVTAVDYDSGRRVAFGRDGGPAATLPEAVVASCSVPGWYRPTVIGSRRYIDGGVRSGTNADLLTRAQITKAYVLAPAASLDACPPRGLTDRLERVVRWCMTRTLVREVALLRDRGLDVTVLTPGPEDLAAMGGNQMDHRRRDAVFETSVRTCAATMSKRRRENRPPGDRSQGPRPRPEDGA